MKDIDLGKRLALFFCELAKAVHQYESSYAAKGKFPVSGERVIPEASFEDLVERAGELTPDDADDGQGSQ